MYKKILFPLMIGLLLLTGCAAPMLEHSRWAEYFNEFTGEQTGEEAGDDLQQKEPEWTEGGMAPFYEKKNSLDEEYAESLKRKQSGSYYFDRLNGEEQTVYVQVLESLKKYSKDMPVSCLDNAVLEKVFQSVMNDHPEIFYVDGYTYTQYYLGEELKMMTFSGAYNVAEKEIPERESGIEAYVRECLGGMPEGLGDYEKVKYIYEYIIEHTEYETGVPDNQNICSVFLNGKSVCQGYAKATQYLLDRIGIECVLVIGRVSGGEGHAWNLARLDGDWYYIDTTWGDASYQIVGGVNDFQGQLPPINYDYLCVTTEQILQTHYITEETELPLCDAVADNYYVKEGKYFTSLDKDKLKVLFDSAYQEEESYVTLKCADHDVYEALFGYLIEDQGVFEYLSKRQGRVSYADNREQLSLSFWL